MTDKKIDLSGKAAVVTGAGGGIGRALAVELARAGASVVVNDVGVSVHGEGRSDAPAQETKQLIEDLGGKAVISSHSVSEWESAKEIVRTSVEAFGRIDIVVNNAGILQDAIFHKMTPEQWLAVVAVHMNGSFFVSRAAADHFRTQESGSFVHMTSTSGLIGNQGQANYSAAKLGIVGLSRSIAIDMARFNVRSNCIAPSAWSRMAGSIQPQTPAQAARLIKVQGMTPDKNAPLVVYLASDAAKHVTGQVFATRMHEFFLMSQSRPVRSMHRDSGWTPETIAEHGMPAMAPSFTPLDKISDVFSWDPA